MERPIVVIANADPAQSALLAKGLRDHVRSVMIARNCDELQYTVRKHRAEIVIADLETVGLKNIGEFHNEFSNVNVVCTHRVPDERMWAESLGAGATDCCSSSDVDDVLRAALRRPYKVRIQAA